MFPRPISPLKGAEGTEVIIKGVGLDEAARFFFSGKEATVIEAGGTQAKVKVPGGARSGPIEVHGRGGIIVTSGESWFVMPPEITGLAPSPVLAGGELNIFGINLPSMQDSFTVTVLDKSVQVVAATPSMLKVLVPDVSGTGVVEIAYEGFTVQSPTAVEVQRETVLLDMVETAREATWSTAAGVMGFGTLGEPGAGSVQFRDSEHMEDDRLYGPVIYLHPPRPSNRALRGEYPVYKVPQGRLELRLEFGMLWTAAAAADEITEVDGVIFEVGFHLTDTGEEIPLLPRTVCVHDGSLERFKIDAGPIAGLIGRVVLSVFPGRNGLRDDAALITGELILKS